MPAVLDKFKNLDKITKTPIYSIYNHATYNLIFIWKYMRLEHDELT